MTGMLASFDRKAVRPKNPCMQSICYMRVWLPCFLCLSMCQCQPNTPPHPQPLVPRKKALVDWLRVIGLVLGTKRYGSLNGREAYRIHKWDVLCGSPLVRLIVISCMPCASCSTVPLLLTLCIRTLECSGDCSSRCSGYCYVWSLFFSPDA